MPRPRSLTQEGIAAAALAVLDRDGRDGLDALTMRAVATELGMATMSLYRYVADKEQLEALVVDHVLAGVDLTLPPRARWRTQVTTLLERLRDAVRAHPAAVPLMMRHRHTSRASLRWIEAMLAALTTAGFTGRHRVLAQRTLVAFLFGTLQNEHYASLSGPGTAAMATMPTAEHPTLVETAAVARRMSADEEFRGGLAIVLDGLVSRPSR